MTDVFAFAIGHSRRNALGDPLDYLFPSPLINPNDEVSNYISSEFKIGVNTIEPDRLEKVCDQMTSIGSDSLELRSLARSDKPLDVVFMNEDQPIASTAEAYLKLHLLSHRLALPNTINLEGIFAALPNNIWTNNGPIDPREFLDSQISARLDGSNLEVLLVDKFPRMTNYVVPGGVRIADSSRIRLGAYIGDGTTVMHEGQINFNSGAIGPNMVEGRISQGVILGANSDLGGSSSTMGTLSGGGEIKVSIGENCLIGANAGTGIPLGDRCTIEAGLYITASTPIQVYDENHDPVTQLKAKELSGGSDMLFIRNGKTGTIECRTNKKAIALNKQLHTHN